MGADSLMEELSGASALLQAQTDAGMNANDVKEMMARSFEARIDAHPTLSASDKSNLTSEITRGPWNAEQKKMLATSVLGNGLAKSKRSASTRANQKAYNIENLIPMGTMVRLRDPTKYSVSSMLSLVGSAARTLGIENPDNTTLFRMVAIVASTSETSMNQDEVWTHMSTLQKYVKSKANSDANKVEYLIMYPPTAELLPADIQKNAYPDGILPPELNWPELDTVLGESKMKGARTLKTPKDTNPKGQVLVSASPSKPDPGSSSPMPSPSVFRFRTDSRILSSAASFASPLADHGKNELAAHGKSELDDASDNICSKCKGHLVDPADEKNEDDEDDENEEDDEKDSELDSFEKGVIGALDTRLALKKRPASMKAMSAMKSMKATKPMKGVKSMKAMKTMVTPMKLMTKETPMKAMKACDVTKKKAVPGWSLAKRVKQYPSGCGKCRSSPGCTYSCFNGRGQIY